MGEAILVKLAVADGGANMSGIPTEGKFESNIQYKCTRSGRYWISCVGGGGGGGAGWTGAKTFSEWIDGMDHGQGKYKANANAWGSGGGSGYVTQAICNLNEGETYQITIGDGGTWSTASNGTNGGVTSFGALLSANGGTGGISPNKMSNNFNTYMSFSGFPYGKGFDNGATFVNYKDNQGDTINTAGNGGFVTANLNALGFMILYNNGNGSHIYCGRGGNGGNTSATSGNSGCVFVNYLSD